MASSRATSSPWMKLFWPAIVLALLLLWNWRYTKDFMRLTVTDGHVVGSLVDVARNGAPAALTGLGLTLVIATGGVDLSVGAVMAIVGAIAAMMGNGYGLAAILPAALGISLLCGLWNGTLVALFRIQPIVATLLLMTAGRGIAQLITNGQQPTFHNAALDFIGKGYFLGLPFAVTIVVVTLVLAILATRATALGLFLESVGDNELASRFAGLNDRSIKLAAYAFSGLCAGVAGLIAVGNIGVADANNVGVNMELDAILAAVIGGTALTGGRFSLLGTILGALIIQTLRTTILQVGLDVQYNDVVKAMVVLIVCLLQAPKVQRWIGSLWPKRSAAAVTGAA